MTWEIIYIVSSLLLIPIFIWVIAVSVRVNFVFKKYKDINTLSGITAKDLVCQIALEKGLNITVEETNSFIGDHYDPKRKVVALTPDIINSSSVTALAVAAHECGHAVQDNTGYLPLRARNAVIHLSNFSSRLLLPLIILSVIVSIFMITEVGYNFMMWIMVALCGIYGLSALVNLITLPTEYDASRRAKVILDEMNIIKDKDESRGVKKVLGAAAQTYVAALAISLIYFFRMLSYVILVFGRRD